MIRPGEAWGSDVRRPGDLVVLPDDGALADALVAARAVGDRPALAVAGGDLHRTLGSPAAASDPNVARLRRVSLDALRVEHDGVAALAVANVVLRRPRLAGSLWRGPVLAACNAEFVGAFDVAPGGHPGDGRFEAVEVDAAMGVRQRWAARRRLRSGTHLPHPAISLRRRRSVEWEPGGSLVLLVDGRPHGRPRHVRVTVEPDAYDLHL